jgi:hypothetical protein
MATTKKQYREQIKFAKQIIKGIEVLVEGGEDFRNLNKAIEAANGLQIVGMNMVHFIQMLQDEENASVKAGA